MFACGSPDRHWRIWLVRWRIFKCDAARSADELGLRDSCVGQSRTAGCRRGPLGISGNWRIAARLPAWRTTGFASIFPPIRACSACTIGRRAVPCTGCRKHGNLPYWETAAPFRILFHWWSQSFGGQISHAAAVGRDGKGVLLAGRGGSGKSTTAICCVDAGMEYVGDDYVLLTRTPTPTAHSLYNSAKIHTAFLRQALPHWQDRVAGEMGPET